MKRLLFVIGLSVLASGCTTTMKDWNATGGSRSDGIIKLSYEEGGFETVQMSEAQAIDMAAERCAKWGYSGAEAFGGSTRECLSTASGITTCDLWRYTKEYQCSN